VTLTFKKIFCICNVLDLYYNFDNDIYTFSNIKKQEIFRISKYELSKINEDTIINLIKMDKSYATPSSSQMSQV
jgi:hypothetical protein